MIDDIIANSRALLSSPPRAEMYPYFPDLIEHAQASFPDVKLPEVIIVYSLNKTCETFTYGTSQYIVYDQYLGQAFNKFNRLVYHEDLVESRAYLYKLIGEEYFLINQSRNSALYLLCHDINKKAKLSDLPPEFLDKKTQLIVVQEAFVLFHEIAHNLISANPDLLLRAITFLEQNRAARLAMSGVLDFDKGKGIIDLNHCHEELASDFLALEFTYTFFSKDKGSYSKGNIIEGICLAFLYMRTLLDMRLKANGTFSSSENPYHLFNRLRYNLMRGYWISTELFKESKTDPMLLVETYEKWEEKIDMEVVGFLDEENREKLLKIFEGKGHLLTKSLAIKMLNLRE